MAFRSWNLGDLVEDDIYDGNTQYNHIEAYENDDNVNRLDLSRPLRNLYENIYQNYSLIKQSHKSSSMIKGIYKDSLIQEFAYGDSNNNTVSVEINPGTGETTLNYSRLSPGIAIHNNNTIVNTPQTHIAERQLFEIFGFDIDNGQDEDVTINYYPTTDRFQARIKERDVNGDLQSYYYVDAESGDSTNWGDSTAGHLSGVQLIAHIYGDTVRSYNNLLSTAIGVNLNLIELESTTKLVNNGDTVYWKILSNGNILGDTLPASGDSELAIVSAQISGSGDSLTAVIGDSRTYLQNFNDFKQYVFLNVPQQWGDSNTNNITDPENAGDSEAPFVNVVNQDQLLVFLRKSTGDSNDSSVWGWKESTLSKLDETRSQRFYLNKDLIIWRGPGDTLGNGWTSIMEMSGDSWTFYGNKTFEDGFMQHNGSAARFSLSGTGDSSFQVDTLGGIDLDTNEGFAINDDSGASFTISSAGIVSINSASGQDIIFTGDSIGIYGEFFTVDTTGTVIIAGDSGILIDDDTGSYVHINFGGDVDINAVAGLTLQENSGSSVTIDTSGQIDISTINGQALNLNGDSIAQISIAADGSIALTSDLDEDVTITASGTGNINLDATGDSVIVSAYAVHLDSGSKIVWGNNFYSTIGDTANVPSFSGDSAGGDSAQGIFVRGSFSAFKVYNAVWNDLAEGFEIAYNYGSINSFSPGFIYSQTINGLLRSNKIADKAAIGVYSDTFAHLLGAENTAINVEELRNTNKKKIPIGISGKVRVWVKEKLQIGDVLVSGKNGFGTKARLKNKIFNPESIIGKVLEPSKDNKKKRVWMHIR